MQAEHRVCLEGRGIGRSSRGTPHQIQRVHRVSLRGVPSRFFRVSGVGFMVWGSGVRRYNEGSFVCSRLHQRTCIGCELGVCPEICKDRARRNPQGHHRDQYQAQAKQGYLQPDPCPRTGSETRHWHDPWPREQCVNLAVATRHARLAHSTDLLVSCCLLRWSFLQMCPARPHGAGRRCCSSTGLRPTPRPTLLCSRARVARNR
jgi:hypothetical protein